MWRRRAQWSVTCGPEQCLSISQTQRDACVHLPLPLPACCTPNGCLEVMTTVWSSACGADSVSHPASTFWSVDCSSVYWRPFNPRVKAGSPHANATSQFPYSRRVLGRWKVVGSTAKEVDLLPHCDLHIGYWLSSASAHWYRLSAFPEIHVSVWH